MVDRISTASLHKQNLASINDVFGELATLNKQISTGRKADNFVDLNGKVELVSGLESKLNKIDTYVSNNSVIVTRLEIMNNSISQLQDIARDFSSNLVLRRSAVGQAGFDFQQEANAALDKVIDALNVDVAGRYLFSGSRTNVEPVSRPIPELATDGQIDNSYYQGNSDVLSTRVSDSSEVKYGVTADELGFQQLIAAIKTAINADASSSSAGLDAAVNLVNASVESLASTRAKVNANTVIIRDTSTQHEQVKLVFSEALANEVDTDIAEASIKIASNETILQATYSTFARLSNLRLSDFL